MTFTFIVLPAKDFNSASDLPSKTLAIGFVRMQLGHTAIPIADKCSKPHKGRMCLRETIRDVRCVNEGIRRTGLPLLPVLKTLTIVHSESFVLFPTVTCLGNI